MKKILKVRWITTLLLVVGVVVFFSFKSGDSRSFQIAKNLDIFNSIVKELDMFYVDTLDPNNNTRGYRCDVVFSGPIYGILSGRGSE